MTAITLDHGRRADLGVVIARFQVPKLTPGHRQLIETAVARHDRVLIVLGERPARRQQKHALDYALRAMMVRSSYPSVETVKFNDVGSDSAWNQRLDDLVAKHAGTAPAVLYGGRQSFITTYEGRYDTCDVGLFDSLSGTAVREQVAAAPIDSSDFRAGVIYGVVNDFPVAYQAVDVAVLKLIDGIAHVLLGRRHALATSWSLIGGISDPDDESLEVTGVRELAEETHVVADDADLIYVCSKKVRDWRYADGPDDIKTALFLSWVHQGTPTVTEEMVELRWFPVVSAATMARGTHQFLLEQLARKVL